EDRRLMFGVVQSDVSETESRFFPMLRLEIDTSTSKLHLNKLLKSFFVALTGGDVANVAVESGNHALLRFSELFGLELFPLSLGTLAIFLRSALWSQTTSLAIRLTFVNLIVHL